MKATLSPAQVAAMMQPKRSKYNVDRSAKGKAKRTLDGVVYDSVAESEYAGLLRNSIKCGLIHSVERQVPIRLEVNGHVIAKLVIDFHVRYPNGRTELIEVKGHETAVYKLKRKLFRAIYGYDFKVVKC
jgi:Protein of unknown function (DUF1064)